jgi:hypothetical protein
MNRWQTARMDLIELTRSIQADRQRQIDQETRRRRLMDRPTVPTTEPSRTAATGPATRPGRQPASGLPSAR